MLSILQNVFKVQQYCYELINLCTKGPQHREYKKTFREMCSLCHYPVTEFGIFFPCSTRARMEHPKLS